MSVAASESAVLSGSHLWEEGKVLSSKHVKTMCMPIRGTQILAAAPGSSLALRQSADKLQQLTEEDAAVDELRETTDRD